MSLATEPARTLEHLCEQVRAAAAAQRPLRIRAGGTKDFYGNATVGELLDPRPFAGIVSYEPTELVMTARCGASLSALEAALESHGQMLAFEPPHFGSGATLGGCIAAGLAGPRRAASGPLSGAARDHVLGVKLLDGRGEVLSFGGTVMKNVAGYDVSRLLVGSLGTLGVLLEVSLKVVPKPAVEKTVRFECDADAALARFGAAAGKPWPISASLWHDGLAHVRLSGANAAVNAAAALLGGEPVAAAEATALWLDVREHTLPFFAVRAPLWRISVPATAAPLELPGGQLLEWGGALRWLVSPADATTIRARAAALGGHATLFRGGRPELAAFTAPAPVLARIQARLKAEFDPAGIFNPGRMHADAPRG
jgi:glycolate oxidase FAD binding subunit